MRDPNEQTLMQYVQDVFPFGSTNRIDEKKTLQSKHALSVFACAQQEKAIKTHPHPLMSKINPQAYSTYMRYLKALQEPKDKKSREDYLHTMILITKMTGYALGFGNCEPMADVCFIEAARRELSCGIHYIRFDNKQNSTIEEVNVVVLGNWPEPGCIILSPWENTTFEWTGNFKNAVFQERQLNRAHCLFSIPKHDPLQEKKLIKQWAEEYQLTPAGLKEDPYRAANRLQIKNAFLSHLSFFSFGYLNYAEFVCLGMVNKKAYDTVKAIQKELQSSEEVQSILKMPRD